MKILGFSALMAILFGCADERPFSEPQKVQSIADIYPHSKDWRAQHIQHLVVKASKGDSNRSNCLSCHESRQVKKGPKLGDEISCGSTCHTSDKPVSIPMNLESCLSCHTSDAHQRILHSPMRKDQECTSCHEVHGADFRSRLKFDIATQCSSCHNPISHQGKTSHSLVSNGNCTTCHGIHGSNPDPISTLGKRGLCLSCHNKEIKIEGSEPRVIPNMATKFSETYHIHGPAAAVSCTDTCHNPHSSPYERLLNQVYPLGLYNRYQESPNTYALCFKCHSSSILKASQFNTNFRTRTKNLHWVHVVNGSGNPEFGRSCNICHDPHSSKQASLIRKTWKMGQYDAPLDFTATQTGGSCTTACHATQTYDRERD